MRIFIRRVFRLLILLLLLGKGETTSSADWPMPGANSARTSWSDEEVPGRLTPLWYRPIEPYISQNVQIIAAEGLVYVSTARGLYAFHADDGETAWVYPTSMPLGHSPAIHEGVAYVAGFDRRLHAIEAHSGRLLWTFDEALAGYRTSPLVVDNLVLLGNRDGNFYAVHAEGTEQAGQLAWRFPTGGPLLYSAAYHNGKVYFASQDLHAYCLDARLGRLIWKSSKFHFTAGFHSIWPVVWAEKNKVVFCGNTPNYRGISRPGSRSVANGAGHYHDIEHQAIYGDQTRGTIGATGNQTGDWPEGSMTVDMARGVEYLQKFPHHRTMFVLDLDTGAEYTFQHDGQPAYAPFLLWGSKQQGPRAAPVVGPDQVLYQATHYRVAATFGRGQVAGWTLGSRYLSIPNPRKHNAWDEPLGFAMGGNLIYWSLCCDREMGAHRTSGDGAWQYVSYNLPRLAPGYDLMWASVGDQDGTGNRLWGAYGSNNGIYHNHTSDQNPPIPYQGKLFIHRSNCLLAFGPASEGPGKLELARVKASSADFPVARDETWLKDRLATEVQRILDAGPLRTGYFDGGQHFNRPIWGDAINDYFAQPGETVWALLRALPFLPDEQRDPVRDYVRAWQQQFPMQSVAHIGWRDGAKREHFDLPPEVQADLANYGPRPQSQCRFWSFPPQAAYAMWKYAEEFGDAEEFLERARRSIVTLPEDDALIEFPYIANAFIAGCVGVLNLERLAGLPESADVRSQLDRLLKLRADTFSPDTPWTFTNRGSHVKRLSVLRNFLYLTPELAEHLRTHACDKVVACLNEIERVAPYWFVTHYEGCLQESNIQNLQDYGAVFQARAWILREPREHLDRYLDVPAFAVGDLNYLHQLISLLETPLDNNLASEDSENVR